MSIIACTIDLVTCVKYTDLNVLFPTTELSSKVIILIAPNYYIELLSSRVGGLRPMSIKIGILGTIEGISKKVIDSVHQRICLEVTAECSDQEHQALSKIIPLSYAKSTVHFSVFTREKIFHQFKGNLEIEQLIGQDVYAVGVPNLDLPLTVVEGDIGVFAYHLVRAEEREDELILLEECRILNNNLKKSKYQERSDYFNRKKHYEAVIDQLSAALIESQKQPGLTFDVLTSEIIVPPHFTRYNPYKVEAAIAHYQTFQELPPISVVLVDHRWMVIDGYTKLLAAKSLELERVRVSVGPPSSAESTGPFNHDNMSFQPR